MTMKRLEWTSQVAKSHTRVERRYKAYNLPNLPTTHIFIGQGMLPPVLCIVIQMRQREIFTENAAQHQHNQHVDGKGQEGCRERDLGKSSTCASPV